MSPAVLFGMNFLAYAILLIIIVAVIMVGVFIGIKWRKSKDAKAALTQKNVRE